MRITIYLLRRSADLDRSVIKSAKQVTELEPRQIAGLEMMPFLILGDASPPSWASDLSPLVDLSSRLPNSTSAGAVVLIRRRDRVFALTYGTGYHAIESSMIEPGFGVRVAAGLISERRIRGVQTRGIASNSRDQRTLLPSDGSFPDLDVRVDEDWLRHIAGKTDSPDVASTAAGADSLRLTAANSSLARIGEKLDALLELFEGEAFREKFPFLDQITPLRPKDHRIDALDEAIERRMREGDSTISFATPDPFDTYENDFDHYEMAFGRPLGRFEITDLDPASILELVAKLPSNRNALRDVELVALDSDGGMVDRRRKLKAYVLAEQAYEGKDYLLTAGQWFSISSDFVERVTAAVSVIEDISDDLALPEWNAEMLRTAGDDISAEGSYNKMLNRDRGYALLDKNLARFGHYNKLEVADLLTRDGELLCVKSASSSTAHSHLVAQAVNSAAAWGSKGHREILQSAWRSLGNDLDDELTRDKAKFVLAIATTKPGPLHESLFFFTKVLLASGLTSLAGSQLRVALARIPMRIEPAAAKRPARSGVSFVDAADEDSEG